MGNIKAKRDWGFAKDYVNAMWLMLQQTKPDDYVVGTGIEHSVEEFADIAFSHVGLNYKDYIIIDENLKSPSEVESLIANYKKANQVLEWEPKISFKDLVIMMVENDLKILKNKDY